MANGDATKFDTTFVAFLSNVAKLVLYVTLIVGIAWGAFTWKTKMDRLQDDVTALRAQAKVDNEALRTQVAKLVGRDEADRWLRGFNARMKRAHNRLGWEYEPVE